MKISMAEEKANVIKATGFYAGHSAKGNFDVDLKIGFTEEHVSEAIQFVAGIGSNLKMVAIVRDNKVDLGLWNVFKVMVDRNAQAKVTFKTSKDNTFVERLAELMADEENITIKAKIIPME